LTDWANESFNVILLVYLFVLFFNWDLYKVYFPPLYENLEFKLKPHFSMAAAAVTILKILAAGNALSIHGLFDGSVLSKLTIDKILPVEGSIATIPTYRDVDLSIFFCK